jgi:BirA family biotin operon repressor/biotin-[acetyl-CoA-carboxylase] ligase
LYGNRALIRDEYISLLYRAGEWHTYRAETNIFKGIIKGISETGSLIIEKEDSSVSEFSFKEVDYIH